MLKKIKEKRDERGFTLIELLIVVAIIAILAAIAIPQFSGYRNRATRASMVADAKNIATMFEAYFTDYGQYATAIQGNSITGPATANWPTADFIAKASKGNTITAAIVGSNTYSITVANTSAGTNSGGTNYSPLTLSSTGACTFNTGDAC